MTDLDIVIVNWNSGDLLRECVASLAASSMAPRLAVTIVDNASQDGSADALQAGTLRLDILRNAVNEGFGVACNQGAARGNAPFLLFLNPDTRVFPQTLTEAVAALRERESVGILGIRLVDGTGRTQRTCAREPTVATILGRNVGLDRLVPHLIPPHFMTEWDHEDTRDVDQVMGAFLLIRRPLFEEIGGFDERYFVYYEDVDLCVGARRRGAGVLHFAGTSAWHEGGGTTRQVKDRRLFYLMRSQVLYVEKWCGRAAALATLFVALAFHVPIRAIQSVAVLDFGGAAQSLKGGWLLLHDLPRLGTARKRRVTS